MSTYTNLLFHIIYSTKYRKPTIQAGWQDELYGYVGGVIREQKGTLLAIGGIADHVHLLAQLSPAIAVSDVLRLVKANSSKWINLRKDVRFPFQWQSGYAAFSVSQSQAPDVIAYIGNQAEHHRTRSFQDEFLAILQRHQIDYDPQYVFEQDIIG